MTRLKKIVSPLLLAGWVILLQSAIFTPGNSLLSIANKSVDQHETLPADTGFLFNTAPLLPGAFVEANLKTGHEVEPDPRPGLSFEFGTALPNADNTCLKVSHQSESHDSTLKLLFPFHTYL